MSTPYQSPSAYADPTAYANPTVHSAYADVEPTSAGGTATAFPTYQPARPASSLDLLVSDDQREKAQGFLQEAYADGRLTHGDFEQRLDQVLGAQTRRDLNAAFYGLVSVAPTTAALGLHPAYRPSLVNQNAGGRTGKAMAAVAHFSVFFTWFVGPLVMYMLGTKGSYAKRQAAQAFNFQIYTIIGGVLGGLASGILDNGVIMALGFVGWFVLTLVGGVKASQGEEWTNPVNKAIKWKPLDEH